MRTLGIDLAAQPKQTAAVVVRWEPGCAVVELVETHIGDDRFRELSQNADKVGVDVPFGWPDAFVAAVGTHHEGGSWPGTADTRRLRYRRTDLFVQAATGRWPLSVSTDRIGITAFRAASLLAHVDRTGGGTFVEVYPRASLDRFRVEPTLAALRAAAPWLDLDAEHAGMCNASRDCFDALVASLTTRAAASGECEPIPAEDAGAAEREGWIALPREGALDRLV